jgi:hypothetical protein
MYHFTDAIPIFTYGETLHVNGDTEVVYLLCFYMEQQELGQ